MSPVTAPLVKSCTLCGAEVTEIFRQLIIGKYDAGYYRCPNCDLIQTDEPIWFQEAPWTKIAPLDTGAVTRSIGCADLVAALMGILEVDPDAPSFDLGGGNGLFVRLMRDRGYNFLWYDRYEANVHAIGCEADPDASYAVVTCFEVFEHLPNAGEVLAGIFAKQHDMLVVSTCLHNGDGPSWWYYLPDVGGHVSFYSAKTMAYLAEKWGYTAICSPEYTLFLKRPLSTAQRRLIERMLVDKRFVAMTRRVVPAIEPLINYDYQRLRSRILPEVSGHVSSLQRRHARTRTPLLMDGLAFVAGLPNRRPFSWMVTAMSRVL